MGLPGVVGSRSSLVVKMLTVDSRRLALVAVRAQGLAMAIWVLGYSFALLKTLSALLSSAQGLERSYIIHT